jgi:hypothetical protein
MNLYQQQTQQTYNYIAVVVKYHRLSFYIHNKMIGDGIMKTIIKQDKKLTITITYNNEPSDDAIRNYAEKLKKTIDSKMPAS